MTGSELSITINEMHGFSYISDIQRIIKTAFRHKIYLNKDTW